MIISVNTEAMNQLAGMAAEICAELSAANDCLAPVTVHDDWNCAERDRINDIIINIKKFSDCLKDNAESVSSAVRSAADSFDEFERKQPQSLQNLHGSLSKTLSVYTPSTAPLTQIIGGNSTINPIIKNLIKKKISINVTPYQLYTIANLDIMLHIMKW